MINEKETCEKAYYYEHDRIDKIQSRMTIPMSILTLIGGAIANILPNYLRLENGRLTQILDIIFLLLIVSFCITIFFLIRFYLPKKYGFIPSWSELDKYKDKLNQRYPNNKDIVDEKITSYYITTLKNAIDINHDINRDRMKYMRSACICICIQIPLILIMYFIFTYINIYK